MLNKETIFLFTCWKKWIPLVLQVPQVPLKKKKLFYATFTQFRATFVILVAIFNELYSSISKMGASRKLKLFIAIVHNESKIRNVKRQQFEPCVVQKRVCYFKETKGLFLRKLT